MLSLYKFTLKLYLLYYVIYQIVLKLYILIRISALKNYILKDYKII